MANNPLSSRRISICINKPTNLRIIISALEIVQSRLYAAVVATIAKLANYREVFSSKNDVTLGGYIRC